MARRKPIPPLPSLRQINAELAERSLVEFIRQAWPHLDPSLYCHGWHIEAIAEHLEAVSRGDIRRLIINIPPRHMKSLATVAWRAWTWAQSPPRHAQGVHLGASVRFLTASYSHHLSARDNLKLRRLLISPWYQGNWSKQVKLARDQNEKARFENSAGGFSVATSVDGATTGEGGDVIIVDDPHNVREAESETKRAAVVDWWDETMATRLNNPNEGAYVVIMQRVHERDLCGHILAKEDDWAHLCLPAEYEKPAAGHRPSPIGFKDPRRKEGTLLWPKRFDRHALNALKRNLGSYASAGQLQQRPVPRGGGLFRREWFEIVRAAPAGGRAIRGWDLAASQTTYSAYTVGVRLKRLNDTYYIEDVIRFRGSALNVETAILNAARQDGIGVRISLPQDPGQAGKAQVQYLIGRLSGYTATASPESGDKVARADPVSAQAEAGNIKIVKGPWNDAFLEEIAQFPKGAYLDQVDALARAFHELQNRGRGTQIKISGT